MCCCVPGNTKILLTSLESTVLLEPSREIFRVCLRRYYLSDILHSCISCSVGSEIKGIRRKVSYPSPMEILLSTGEKTSAAWATNFFLPITLILPPLPLSLTLLHHSLFHSLSKSHSQRSPAPFGFFVSECSWRFSHVRSELRSPCCGENTTQLLREQSQSG